ncbi:MAG: hypothetical protein OXE02_08280 [Chloroflexi bacterium]|nr:hypothetical protein [Chloroflexota bacterium]
MAGAAEHGGLQIVVYPMKAAVYEKMRESWVDVCYAMGSLTDSFDGMGLAPGGLMRQEIYEDDYGFEAWDTSVQSRCFVHVLNSVQYLAEPPGVPPTAAAYTAAGLPWFEYYGGDLKALEGSKKLAGLDSVAARRRKAR